MCVLRNMWQQGVQLKIVWQTLKIESIKIFHLVIIYSSNFNVTIKLLIIFQWHMN